MYLLPAHIEATPTRRGVAIWKFVGVRRVAKQEDTIYLPAWSSSTLLERTPEPEIENIPSEEVETVREIKSSIQWLIDFTEAVLDYVDRPIDSSLIRL